VTRPVDHIVAARAAGRFTDDVRTEMLASASKGASQQPTGPPHPPPKRAYSIREFCVAVGISQAFYFEIKREGRGPREMKLSNRRLISVEEAADLLIDPSSHHIRTSIGRRLESRCGELLLQLLVREGHSCRFVQPLGDRFRHPNESLPGLVFA
jgi:hypothetical protein